MTFARRAGLAALGLALVAAVVAVAVDLADGPESVARLPALVVPLVVASAAVGLVAATIEVTRATRSGDDADPAERDDQVRRGIRDSVLCACTVLAAPFILVLVSALLTG